MSRVGSGRASRRSFLPDWRQRKVWLGQGASEEGSQLSRRLELHARRRLERNPLHGRVQVRHGENRQRVTFFIKHREADVGNTLQALTLNDLVAGAVQGFDAALQGVEVRVADLLPTPPKHKP